MRILTIENKDFSIPSDWNELDKPNLLEICRIMLLPLDERYKRFLLLGHFTDVSFKAIQKWEPTAIPEILSVFDYLFKESRLTINHFAGVGKMMGPEPGLTNFSFEQFFAESEAYYYLTCKNKNGHDLDSLINCMYNFNGTEENKAILLNLSEGEKLAIFLFYQGCSAFIKSKFREVFTGGEKTKSDGLEFARLVNRMNQGDLSKNEAIKKSNLYEALTYLQNIIRDGSK